MNKPRKLPGRVVEGLKESPLLLAFVVVVAMLVGFQLWVVHSINGAMERRDNLFAQLAKDCGRRD